MFFLMTNFNNEKTNEEFLLTEIEGLPRVVAMSLNLGLLEPTKVITESNKVAKVLEQYNIDVIMDNNNVSNFEKVGNVVETLGLQKAVSIFTPETFLDNIDTMSSLMTNYQKGNVVMEPEQQGILTFFTEDAAAALKQNVFISLNHWGEVSNLSNKETTNMRQVEFYVMNPKTLKNLNVLNKTEEFNGLVVSPELREQTKITYFSIPLKVLELDKIAIEG